MNNNSTYRRLGDYIREVDVRNTDLRCSNLLGLSIAKKFIPSIANMVGTDLRPYKIVKHNQFAYVPVTSRNGEKITVALYTDDEPAIISQAYIVFEIVGMCDTVETVCTPSLQCDQLLPEYLMMWFRRAEFDRYARYHSHGSARKVFDWEEMCNVQLPVPSIEEQLRIVARYQAIQNRIANNKQTIAKLEEAAQALYRKMFVDDVDVENLPEGWRMGCLGEVAEFVYGKMPNRDSVGNIPIYSGYAVTGYTDECMFNKSHIVVIARGDAGSGKICLSPDKFFLTNLAIAVLLKEESMKYYLFYHLCDLDTSVLRSGSAQAQVTINSLMPFEILIPRIDVCKKFNSIIEHMQTQIKFINKENEKLIEMLSLLMVGMGR